MKRFIKVKEVGVGEVSVSTAKILKLSKASLWNGKPLTRITLTTQVIYKGQFDFIDVIDDFDDLNKQLNAEQPQKVKVRTKKESV